VRECGALVERNALKERLRKIDVVIRSRKLEQVRNNLSDVVKRASGVVVAMPSGIALLLASDPRNVYENIETLVGAGARQAPPLEHDKHRKSVSGVLFGTYGDKLRYGILSLDGSGLPTYGDVSCRLRAVAISDRTSFLELNSYTFVNQHGIVPGTPIPVGYRAVWDNCDSLVLVKLSSRLAKGQGVAEWQRLMCYSDGKDRKNDDFIEAHIYDGFTIDAIEGMVDVKRKRDRSVAIEVKLALDRFSKRKQAP
jgi:hypothetical protein